MTDSLSDIVVKATPGEWKVFDHYCGRDPETAGEEYASTRLIGLGQFDTIAEVRMGSDDVDGDFEANAQLIALAPTLAALVLEAREALELTESLCAWLLHRFGPGSPEGKEASCRLAKVRTTLAKLESL